MLRAIDLVAFVPTKDSDKVRDFYEGVWESHMHHA
jgi:hypothetical protein